LSPDTQPVVALQACPVPGSWQVPLVLIPVIWQTSPAAAQGSVTPPVPMLSVQGLPTVSAAELLAPLELELETLMVPLLLLPPPLLPPVVEPLPPLLLELLPDPASPSPSEEGETWRHEAAKSASVGRTKRKRLEVAIGGVTFR
jgi:hypothetical protein